jgi:hypothetical protein
MMTPELGLPALIIDERILNRLVAASVYSVASACRHACEQKAIVPFAHVMMGTVRLDSTSSIWGDCKPVYFWGTAAGGGIDLNIRQALAIRILQADYMLVGDPEFPIDRGNFRFSTGIVLKFR